jgi:hypothetical protein
LIQAVLMKDVTKNLAIIFQEQRRSHSLFYWPLKMSEWDAYASQS